MFQHYDLQAPTLKYLVVVHCQQILEEWLSDIGIETHHRVPVKDGGLGDTKNLIHLHVTCHKQEHNKTKSKA
ncbi:MAG: HNH endonuclease [Cyanobacteria bacterium P01_A01_bin.83]